ncbi:hypothetical protein H6F74_05635 [Trichocoleus sp. FACHB-90]|uniref:hypothetical protein n=1 Tax=Cyanophyceae TaxID=3028117 RepID=UPI0016835C60|nr:hypothetical protein [Trichocoleus sp. FACHB-90]MBD1925764.1 hypothetical protein [Trichocoleus sp. FACHB-90]
MPIENDVALIPALEDWRLATLSNGWINVGGVFAPTAYYKDPLGIVHLRGLVSSGTGIIFTLPVGYRPTGYRLIFPVLALNAIARIDVLLNGSVNFVTGTNSNVSLDGITFR